jgi:thymidylate synthase ThyX
MVEEGIEHNGELFKVRKEDARFIIPNGSKTTIMVTMLGDGLKNFLHERTHEHAQWEIREVACLVDDFIKGKIS